MSIAVDSATGEVFVGTPGNQRGSNSHFAVVPYNELGEQVGPVIGPPPGGYRTENPEEEELPELYSMHIAVYESPQGPVLYVSDYTYFFEEHSGSWVWQVASIPEPSATTNPASPITNTAATLNASVNPEGESTLSCKFEWGTEAGVYTHEASCAPNPGSASTAKAVKAEISGLTPKTTYHYRVVERTNGGTAEGADVAFTTKPNPPALTTGAASELTQTAADLAGTVNPEGTALTECAFQYGTTTAYGSAVACASLPSGSGTSPLPVSAALTGLAANTTYHYRVVAGNGSNESGADQTFTTLANTCATDAALCPPPVEPSNKITLGAAKQKGSAIDVSVTVPGPGSLAASGKDLKAVSASPSGAGALTLKLSPTSAGSKLLKKKHKLSVKVTFTFTPTGGTAGTATKTIDFKTKSKKKH